MLAQFRAVGHDGYVRYEEGGAHIKKLKLFGLYIGLVNTQNFSDQVKQSTCNKHSGPLIQTQLLHNPKHWK